MRNFCRLRILWITANLDFSDLMGLRYVQLGVRGLLRVFQAQPQHGPHGLLLQLQWHYGPHHSLESRITSISLVIKSKKYLLYIRIRSIFAVEITWFNFSEVICRNLTTANPTYRKIASINATPARTLFISGLKSRVMKLPFLSLKMMVKSGLEFILKLTEPLQSCCCCQCKNICPDWPNWPGSLAGISEGAQSISK